MAHEFKHPNYYKKLNEKMRKLTSSQATVDKQAIPEPRVQASSQSAQAPKSDDQGTSAQALCPGYKQQG
jgi:hypothetical protein